MLRRSVQAIVDSGVASVIVVTGHEAEQVRAALDGIDVAFVHAAGFAEGMSASLKAGVGAVPAACAGVLICLGDMPYVRPESIRQIAESYDPADPWVAAVPVHQGRRGNPVLLGRPLFQEITRLTGDQGARGLLAKIQERVLEIAIDDPGVLRDIDRPEALGG
jgi:molybdenum cofactor cytidylyltransferase